jgi:methyl-accepting chemotaxis protein
MNSWTISRRIIFGFTAMVVISAALGGFALWRLESLSQSLAAVADNSLPSVLVLNECASLARDNIFACQQYGDTESPEQRTAIEERINANRERMDELFKQYDPALVADGEDRRLFDEAKRTRAAFVTVRGRYLDLVRQGKGPEHKKMLAEVVIPAYLASVKAVDADVDHNKKLGIEASQASKSSARSSVILICFALGTALVVGCLMAWKIARSTTRVLGDLATNLDLGASQTASAARQVSSASQTLSSGASEQAASVEETSASLEEISSMIRSTADNAEKAKALSGEAHVVAQTGSRTMGEMTQAMGEIDTSTTEVAKIVKNIDEIAFQTNILALNAAVEAARAGEAGAGFAVVADEVRSLAQRSAAAAKETAEKIEAVIASSRKGSTHCAKVGEALSQISVKVSSTDSLIAEIATAAREQAQGIEQINTAITQMDQVTQSTSAGAEESASAAEELDAQAGSLKDMVGQLRQLVGGAGQTVTAPSYPTPPAHGAAFPGPAAARPPARASHSKALSTARRKTIPMPGDGGPAVDDDGHFKNF